MYRYAVGLLSFATIWLVFLVAFPRVRRRMLLASLVFSGAGPLSEYWYIRDYWSPVFLISLSVGHWKFGIEDFLFAGFLAGTGVGLFELFLSREGDTPPLEIKWTTFFIRLLTVIVFALLVMLLLTEVFRFNSLPATMVAMISPVPFIIRNNLKHLRFAILTGLTGGLLMWLHYWGFFFRIYPGVIREWWQKGSLSGLSLAGVPIEEVGWAILAIFAVGPVFQFLLRPWNNKFLGKTITWH